MPKTGIKGSAVLLGTAGLYLVYIGVKDVPFTEGLRDIVRGRRPTGRPHLPYVPKIAEALAKLDADVGVTTVGSASRSDMISVGGGILVHKSIAANVSRMRSKAAGQGVSLTGGGYRSHEEQRQLRKTNHCTCDNESNCCSPPTAPVGQSMHERGLAIDFDNCRKRETKVFRWLAANAAAFGLFNLPGEPWHWSTNGH